MKDTTAVGQLERMIKNKKIFIIAEAGVNHNGSIKIAKRLIEAAAESGCGAVKFQTFRTAEVVTQNAPKARYQIKNTGSNESQFEMLKKLELSPSEYKELFYFCKKKKIIFMSTPFDKYSTDFLDGLGMAIFKIPSGEITNKPLIKHIASKIKPIILSTGMSYLDEVKKAVDWIRDVWKGLDKKPQLILLHCVSNYPAEADDVNLLAMRTLESTFGIPVGFSDHTMGTEVAIAAAAIGAQVIEKHFTLDRNMRGPDHRASLTPNELKTMVRVVRNIEKALGNGIKRPSPSEFKNRLVARKGIVASRDIKRGEIFTEENITVKRPERGIGAMQWERVLGKIAKKNFKYDSVIEL